MAEKHCPVCGDQVQNRMACIMEHFAFYQSGTLRYWRGNIAAFGLVDGLKGSICLSFPFINILMNWRYRKSRIVMPPPDHG
jgi:hypothetical protein